MSDWFFMLGEPLGAVERQSARSYLSGLGMGHTLCIHAVSNWRAALQVITNPEWDQTLWQAEQHEATRLRAKAIASFGEQKVWLSLSNAMNASEAAHGSAAIASARLGCADAGFIRAAAGAAAEASHLATLAELAGEGDAHPFRAKQNIFVAGHWPLAATSERYYVF